MNCAELHARLDEYLDGTLGTSETAACAQHLRGCAPCARRAAKSSALTAALRGMPVPPLRPGFIDAALARAVSSAPPAPKHRPRVFAGRLLRRRVAWLGAAIGGAAAAGLAMIFLRSIDFGRAQGEVVALAVNETREVGVLIDSESPLPNATIRIIVTGGVALEGYEESGELAWQTDLDGGPNLLSLPLVARAPGAARLVAIVEYAGKTKRVAVELKVS